jgi:hypothetical protein
MLILPSTFVKNGCKFRFSSVFITAITSTAAIQSLVKMPLNFFFRSSADGELEVKYTRMVNKWTFIQSIQRSKCGVNFALLYSVDDAPHTRRDGRTY